MSGEQRLMVLLTLPGRNRKERREPDTLQTLTPTLSHLCLSVCPSVCVVDWFFPQRSAVAGAGAMAHLHFEQKSFDLHAK